jgi:predicted porin
MKKLLLGSTALMAAGALAVSPAAAEDPISLNVGGYYWAGVSISDQDVTGVDFHEVTVRQEGEVQFTGSTTLDNGLTVGVNIQLEAWASGDQIDEHFLFLSGDWGRVNIGAENDAAYLMGYVAPAAGVGVNSATVIPFATLGSAPTATTLNANSDANKLTYFTPRFSGFQLGLSFTPNTEARTGSTQTAGLATDNDAGEQSNVISLGANFVESFNGVDIAISGGYVKGDLEAQTAASAQSSANAALQAGLVTAGFTAAQAAVLVPSDAVAAGTEDDREQWAVGLNVGFSGFTVGGSYFEDNNAVTGTFDSTAWDIGATYSTGPWGIGVTYFHSEIELGTGAGEDERDAIELGANYALGPGITIYGAITYIEEDNNSAADSDGIAGTITTSVSF